MSEEQHKGVYKRVTIDPEEEVKAIGVLMGLGDDFRVITETDYVISDKQCAVLKGNGIHYREYRPASD
jgi:hypothetical protein